jgi:aminoglycoside 2'-N-acetyltransferase I
MRVEIKQKDNLTNSEKAELQNFREAVYPPDPSPNDTEASQIEWSGSKWALFIRDNNDRLVSYMGLITRQVKCDDGSFFIGGIGGVATHPDERRQGYAGFGLEQSAQYLREELQVDFSLLVCRDELIPYYQKFGWQLFTGDMMVDQSSGKTKFTFNKPMLIESVRTIPQCDIIDLCGKPW